MQQHVLVKNDVLIKPKKSPSIWATFANLSPRTFKYRSNLVTLDKRFSSSGQWYKTVFLIWPFPISSLFIFILFKQLNRIKTVDSAGLKLISSQLKASLLTIWPPPLPNVIKLFPLGERTIINRFKSNYRFWTHFCSKYTIALLCIFVKIQSGKIHIFFIFYFGEIYLDFLQKSFITLTVEKIVWMS